MMGKKIWAILLGLLMVVTPLAFSETSAASDTGTTVILVSDNAADHTLAQYLANITGAIVVTTTWGIYDPNVTAEIIGYSPDQVIIIGGPDAVVSQYAADLEEYNITVYRWWGANRYDTDLAVIGNATKMFGINFNGSVMVAGNDSAAMKLALKLALQNRSMIVYVNASTNATALMEKLQIRNTVMVQTQASEKIMEKIKEELRECNCQAREIEANVSASETLMLMEKLQERIAAVEEIANLTNSTQLKEELQAIEKLMKQANSSLQAGNYTEAYQLMLKLQVQTEMLLKLSHKEMEFALKDHQEIGLEREYLKLEAQVEALAKLGYNVTNITQVMEQLKEAIQNGDYKEAKKLIKEVKFMIKEIYKEGVPGMGNETSNSTMTSNTSTSMPSNPMNGTKPHKP
ncbi:cell wall-binding repeat-containing protein [Thermococcus sp.]